MKRKTKGTPDNIDKHVGAQLRICRNLAGISQEKLAEAIGVTFQQIQKYERGTNRVSASRLFQFAAILDVKIDYFYEGINAEKRNIPANKASIPNNVFEDKQAVRLMRAYQELNHDTRKSVADFVTSVAKAA
ncbi:MAG: helix-turn-helix domain-containing protein [Alphaproteobacteria bacterium]